MKKQSTLIELPIVIATIFLMAATLSFSGVIISTDGRTVYRLAAAHLSGRDCIIGATYDGRITAFETDGRILWDCTTGGFMFDITAGDLDGDGTDEIAAANSDGKVYCVGADGKIRWTYDLQAPVEQVTVMRISGENPMIAAGGVSKEVVLLSPSGIKTASAGVSGVVRVLRAGDFNGDGTDELFALDMYGQKTMDLILYAGMNLSLSWKGNSKDFKDVWSEQSMSSIAYDIDGDGRDEIITGRAILDADTEIRKSTQTNSRYDCGDTGFRMPFVSAGDLDGTGMKQIVKINGRDITIHDANGKETGSVRLNQGFTDVLCMPRNGKTEIILASSPNGDDSLYRFSFDPDWKNFLLTLPRTGRMAEIESNLTALSESVKIFGETKPLAGQSGPFPVVLDELQFNMPDDSPDKIATVCQFFEDIRLYEREFPYQNLRFAKALWFGEKDLKSPDGKAYAQEGRLSYNLTRQDIAAFAVQLEKNKSFFLVTIGHGCKPFLSLGTIEAILEAAPDACLGFVICEDEQEKDVPYYFQHFVQPVLDICAAHNKMLIMREKGAWWASSVSRREVRDTIFNPKYLSVLVLATEDSNSRSPDMNLAARIGLWLNGDADRFAARTSNDWFSFNRTWEWEYVMTGHPQLRSLAAQASLGASVFMNRTVMREADGTFNRYGSEGFAPFLHMLGKGIIAPPKPEQLRSISSVALRVPAPSEYFVNGGGNMHDYKSFDPKEISERAFGRLPHYFGMSPTPRTDLSYLLWGRRTQFGNFIPPSPFGFVPVLPGVEIEPKNYFSAVWNTDGERLWKDVEGADYSAAREALAVDLKTASAHFPFSVEGNVFFQIVSYDDDSSYIVYLIDPGYLDPATREAVIRPASGTWSAKDRLTGAAVSGSASFTISVPAGSLRIIELTPR